MTQEERHAQMVIALKLMREVIDDVENEAMNMGEDPPGNWEIWRRAGMDWRDNYVTWMVRLAKTLPYADQEFQVTERTAGSDTSE